MNPVTHLLVSIAAPNPASAREAVQRARDSGADGVELRLDLMDTLGLDQLSELAADIPDHWITLATLRSTAEGGLAAETDDERLDRLVEVAPFVSAIDVEFALWQRLNSEQREQLGRSGTLILSRHDTQGRPARLAADLLDMLAASPAEVIKIAWTAHTVRESFEAFELMRECPKPIIAICMGEPGIISRILARKHGAFATFASPLRGADTASGQLSIRQMKQLYRWDAIRRDTAVYGLIGHPVAHSLGPAVHNAAFAAEDLNAIYVPFDVVPGYESFKAFMVEALARPWFDLRGVSITSPHKEHAFRFACEMNAACDPIVHRVGAVNTLSIDPANGIRAHNSDVDAAVEALARIVDLPHPSGKPRSVAILGAGGAARACAAGLTAAGARVTVYNRTPLRAQSLAADFDCAWRPWEDRVRIDADIVINCTTVGQPPHDAESPLDPHAIRPGTLVFDTIYRPRPTRLLMDALARGCRTIDGLDMFLLQAASQWRHWIGRPAPENAMRLAAIAHLNDDPVRGGSRG